MSTIFYEQHLSLLEFLSEKPGGKLQELVEDPVTLESLIKDVFDDYQRSNAQLHQHVAALQARNRELETYAYMVAHDLKEPLSSIILTSNLVTHMSDLPYDELKGYLRQIRSTAYEMNKVISDLLLFAEVSKVEAPAEQVDMNRVVTNVLDRLSYLIKECQAQINLPDVWPDAIGYAPWIVEVWANYISNALKHGGQPPCVELGASAQPDGMVRFWTRDNGPGLPLDAQTQLFTPFSQISRICNPGHGFGLSIVFQLIEKLGGQVGIESELGKGSLFFFTLPTSPASTGGCLQ